MTTKRNRRLEPLDDDVEPEEDLEEFGRAATPLASMPPPGRAASFARAKKIVVRGLKLGAVACGLLGAVAVGRLARDHLHTSPSFAIEQITVRGADRLGEEEVRVAAGLEVGRNVFEHGPEQVRAALERHPWVARARVERRLPGAFTLEIEERHAVALLVLSPSAPDERAREGVATAPEGPYLIGEDATVFKRVEEGDPIDLPLLTGVDHDRFVADRAYRGSLLLEVVALLHDYRAAGLWRREPISEIVLSDTDETTLFVGEDAMQVRLGRGPHLEKLRKLRRVLDRLDAQDSRPVYVFLDNVRRPDRVVVRLREQPQPVVVAAAVDG